jgi:hypothetical protein
MISVEVRAGRLIEVRFQGEMTPAAFKDLSVNLGHEIVRIGQRVVFAADFRTCAALPPELESMLLGQMRSDNWAIERSALLLRPGSPVCVQIERTIALAKNPARQSFTQPAALLEWLQAVLSPAELDRAATFCQELG